MKKVFCVCLCLVIALSLVACGTGELSSEVDLLKEEIEALKELNESLKNQQKEIDALEEELDALTAQNQALQDRIDTLEEIEQSKLPDFADCEIGYQLEVYPKVAFDYKVNEDCIVHIESITATLTAKNVIEEGDVVEGIIAQYEVTIIIVGHVIGTPPTDQYGARLWIDLSWFGMGFSPPRLVPDSEGSFSATYLTTNVLQNCIIYFEEIRT